MIARLAPVAICLLAGLLASGCTTSRGQQGISMPLAGLPPQPLPVVTVPQRHIAPEPESAKPAGRPKDIWEHLTRGYGLRDHSHASARKVAAHHAAHPGATRHTLQRAEPYLWEIIEQVESRGMPLEIALLPAIETRFNPAARSPRGAAGLWQFLPGTGEIYGLQEDWWQDARLDTVAATKAALDYLTYLHGRYDDWLLALAAYNAGEARVMRAVQKNRAAGKPADYWHIQLPDETRKYVPRLLGLAYFIKNADDYGFLLPRVADADTFTIVRLQHQLDLTLAAELGGIPLAEIRRYNPGLKHWTTGPSGTYQLVLPREPGNRLRTALKAMEPDDWMTWERYRIRKGDSLGAIAQRYDSTTAILKRINDLNNDYLRAGNSLLVPVPRHTQQLLAAKLAVPKALLESAQPDHSVAVAGATGPNPPARPRLHKARASTHQIRYQIQPGDSLSAIAKAYDISAEALAGWNNIKPDTILRPGRMLTIWIGTKSSGSKDNSI